MSTDLIGRGIDIEGVNVVFNYDMPETDQKHGNGADTYLHRVSNGNAQWLMCHSVPLCSCVLLLNAITRQAWPTVCCPKALIHFVCCT